MNSEEFYVIYREVIIMKKQIAALFAITFLIAALTGCSGSTTSLETSNISSDYSLTSSKQESSASGTDSADKEKEIVRVNYGEAEIPDIPYEKITEEGSAIFVADDEPISGALDAVIFETHTAGDYTLTLVGEKVRTDLANFPDKIFAKSLYIEVAKDGKIIENGKSVIRDESTGTSNASFECFIIKDKIGNYVDLYKMEKPVVASRYFYPNDGREVKSVVSFGYIDKDRLYDKLLGIHAPKTGIVIDTKPGLTLNDGSGEYNQVFGNVKDIAVDGDLTWCSITASDELDVVDGKMLKDDAAGIKYIFNFENSDSTILYKTTKI